MIILGKKIIIPIFNHVLFSFFQQIVKGLKLDIIFKVPMSPSTYPSLFIYPGLFTIHHPILEATYIIIFLSLFTKQKLH
jgi:hypothetical protein